MELFDALVRWVHILAAIVFIGPQIFLAAIAMPAIRSLDDAGTRAAITRRITTGFGMLGGIALVLLLATGIWNYYEVEDQGLLEFQRYFIALQVKLTLVTLVIILTVLHGAVFGRKLRRLQEDDAPEEEIAATRRWSMMVSMANLGLSLAIVLCAALMGSLWSKMGELR